MKEKSRKPAMFLARFMAGLFIFASFSANPEFVMAAAKVASNFGAITLEEKDVSDNLYLETVFSLGGDIFCGTVRNGYSGLFFATSKDLVNWNLESKYFNLVYGNERFFGINYDGLHYTTDGTKWQKANLPENVEPYSIKFENGSLKLYYMDKETGNRGLMLSKDGETWFDITDDKPEYVRCENIIVLGDKYVALGGAKSGATGVSVSVADKIDENETAWQSIPTLQKEGYDLGYTFYFDGETLGAMMVPIIQEGQESAGENIYCLTSDYINWDEKTWDEYTKITGYDEYNVYNQTSTQETPKFEIDGKRFGGLTVMPYKDEDTVFFATSVTYSTDGVSWTTERAKINLNGAVVNNMSDNSAIEDIAKISWAKDAIEYVVARGYMDVKHDYQTDIYTFGADVEITRQDFVAAMIKSLNIKKPDAPNEEYEPFSDVQLWNGGEYVDIAKRLGLINGIGNNLFAPDKTITREDMMTITYSILNKLGEITPDEGLTALAPYADKDEISEYAKLPISSLVNGKIIAGDGVNINPKKTISRAEVAVIIKNISGN